LQSALDAIVSVRDLIWWMMICSADLGVVPLEQEAFNHYQKNTMSIEILKDDSLQKINFRVKNKVL